MSNLNAVVDKLTVIDEENREFETATTIQEQLKIIGIDSTYRKVSFENVTMGILEFVVKENSDMLCLIHHSRGLFQEIFHSRVAENIAFGSKIPLLVLNN